MHKRGALSGLSVKKVLSQSIESFSQHRIETCVSECSGFRKNICLRREYHDFPSYLFCLTFQQPFPGQLFVFPEKNGIETSHA